MLQHHVKIVGANGQISLGKALAGKVVSIDQVDESTWVIRTGEFIPDSQKWLKEGNNMKKLDKALEVAAKTPARTDNAAEIINKIERLAEKKHGKN